MEKSFPSRPVLALGLFALLVQYTGAAQAAPRPVMPGLDMHYAVAETFVKLKDYASARAVLRLALKSHPGADTGYFRLAELCREAGDKPQAAAAYARALEADPSDARAAFRLASLHEEMGNPLLALSVLKKAAEGDGTRRAGLMPESPAHASLMRASLMERARIYCAMGQDWPALDCYLRAADLGERRAAAAMLKIGKRISDQGDARRAQEVFALVRTAFPGDAETGRDLAGWKPL